MFVEHGPCKQLMWVWEGFSPLANKLSLPVMLDGARLGVPIDFKIFDLGMITEWFPMRT